MRKDKPTNVQSSVYKLLAFGGFQLRYTILCLLLPSSLLWEPFLPLRVAAHLLINNLLRRALGIPSLLLHGNN